MPLGTTLPAVRPFELVRNFSQLDLEAAISHWLRARFVARIAY
jgi:hypothetical protein